MDMMRAICLDCTTRLKRVRKEHLSVSSWLDHSNECENCNSENNPRGRPIFY